MDANINLLAQKKGSILSSEKTLARVRVIAIVCVALLISSWIGVFLLNQVNSPASLQVQQQSLTATVTASKQKTIDQLQLLDRLGHISTILKNRSLLQNNITLVEKQIPDNVELTTFAIDDKLLSLTARSSDLNAVNDVIVHMTALMQSKKLIKTLTIDGITADQKTGKYLLTIDATL